MLTQIFSFSPDATRRFEQVREFLSRISLFLSRIPFLDRFSFVRFFGWLSLFFLVAFLVNNALVVSGYSPPIDVPFFSGDTTTLLTRLTYILAFLFSFLLVLFTPSVTLRSDAHRISDFNIYLIRACFWSVFLVGVVDASIAFMRIEKLLMFLFDNDWLVRQFGRSHFVGLYIHVPLIIAGFILGIFTRTLGFTWLALLIVLAELFIVISRFIFSYEQAFMGDLVRYWYAALFLFASAYTLLDDGHVRVDVLYAGFSDRLRGFINAFGSIFLGMTTSWVIIIIGFGSKQSIINAPVFNFEITQAGSAGMYVKYQMAAFLGVFAITMLIQFVSYYLESVADYRDEPKEH